MTETWKENTDNGFGIKLSAKYCSGRHTTPTENEINRQKNEIYEINNMWTNFDGNDYRAHAEFPCFYSSFTILWILFSHFTMLVSVWECGCVSISHDNNKNMYEARERFWVVARGSHSHAHTLTRMKEKKNRECMNLLGVIRCCCPRRAFVQTYREIFLVFAVHIHEIRAYYQLFFSYVEIDRDIFSGNSKN